jgi:hypothetical protein
MHRKLHRLLFVINEWGYLMYYHLSNIVLRRVKQQLRQILLTIILRINQLKLLHIKIVLLHILVTNNLTVDLILVLG